MIQSLMQNPYILLITSICTVIAIPLTLYTANYGRRVKRLSCLKLSYEIFNTFQETKNWKLKVLYSDKIIQNLVVTKFTIWNSGNETINREDIVKDKPLQITCSSVKSIILDFKIIAQIEETNNINISVQENNNLSLDFDYIDKNEGCILQILHTGSPDDIEFNGKVKGCEKIQNLNLGMNSTFHLPLSWSQNCIMSVVCIIGYLAGFVIAHFTSSAIFDDIQKIIFITVIVFNFVFIIYLIFFIKKNLFYLKMPSKFKKLAIKFL